MVVREPRATPRHAQKADGGYARDSESSFAVGHF
jgi:hypothetical protein